jgi:hypothetical protein
MRKIEILVSLLLVLFIVSGNIVLQAQQPPTAPAITTTAPASGEDSLLKLLFGENLGTAVINSILGVIMLKTAPGILAGLKQAADSTAKINDELVGMIRNEVAKSASSTDAMLEYLKQQDAIAKARADTLAAQLHSVEVKVDQILSR